MGNGFKWLFGRKKLPTTELGLGLECLGGGVQDRMYVTRVSVLKPILVYLYFILYNRGNYPRGISARGVRVLESKIYPVFFDYK